MLNSVEARVAQELLEGASPEERHALAAWAAELLRIRTAEEDGFHKAREAFLATVNGSAAWPLIRRLGDIIKRNAWDERTATERAGIGAATAMVALFGGTFAALTALGTAVSTPLWIVFGSGDEFARHLVDADAPPAA